MNIALGKNKQSADFWRGEEAIVINSELESIKNRLDNAEKEIEVLKTEQSSPNKELIMTELDNRYVKKGETNYGDVVTSSNVDFIKELLNRGYVNVFFDINSTKIQKESLSSVNYLRQFLYDNPYVNASLIGFTDETGSEERKQTLSNNRAKAVFDMLVASGISPNRLSYGGVGEDKTMSKGARQLARKVTFKIN